MIDATSPDAILGQDFLTWLWYRSDACNEEFRDAGGVPFSVSMERRITVEGGEGDERETAAVSGASSPLREARFGLATGKKVSRCLLQLERDGMAFQMSLRAEDLSPASLKTPKVELDDPDADPDALLLEKVYLMETAVSMTDALFSTFLKIRIDPVAWAREVAEMHDWMSRTE